MTAVIAGEETASSNSISVTPSVLSFDIGDRDELAHYYDFTFNADKNDLARVTVAGKRCGRARIITCSAITTAFAFTRPS